MRLTTVFHRESHVYILGGINTLEFIIILSSYVMTNLNMIV